jgi:hypothetical protein
MKYFVYMWYLILFSVLAFSEVLEKKDKIRKQEYIIQIQEKWIDTVTLESQRFGLKYVRKVNNRWLINVLNHYLFIII